MLSHLKDFQLLASLEEEDGNKTTVCKRPRGKWQHNASNYRCGRTGPVMCMHVHKHIFNLSLSLCKCKWERGVPALWLAHRVGSVGFELKGQSGRMELRFWCAARGIMEIHHKLSVMKAGFRASAAVKGKHPFMGLLLLPLRYFL